MASAKFHDKSGLVLAIVAGVSSIAITKDLSMGSLIYSGVVIGTLWLGPDIDTRQSKISQRWGPLSILWRPYRKTHGHRPWKAIDLLKKYKFRSHWPVFGTLERIAYLFMIFGAPSLVIASWMFGLNWEEILWICRLYGGRLIILLAAIELSSSWHIVSDYLPFTRHR